jgi:hypothetical protein
MPTKIPKVMGVDLKHMKSSNGFKGVKHEDFTPIHHNELVHDPPCASEPKGGITVDLLVSKEDTYILLVRIEVYRIVNLEVLRTSEMTTQRKSP